MLVALLQALAIVWLALAALALLGAVLGALVSRRLDRAATPPSVTPSTDCIVPGSTRIVSDAAPGLPKRERWLPPT